MIETFAKFSIKAVHAFLDLKISALAQISP
jgi:hypothetical protein